MIACAGGQSRRSATVDQPWNFKTSVERWEPAAHTQRRGSSTRGMHRAGAVSQPASPGSGAPVAGLVVAAAASANQANSSALAVARPVEVDPGQLHVQVELGPAQTGFERPGAKAATEKPNIYASIIATSRQRAFHWVANKTVNKFPRWFLFAEPATRKVTTDNPLATSCHKPCCAIGDIDTGLAPFFDYSIPANPVPLQG